MASPKYLFLLLATIVFFSHISCKEDDTKQPDDNVADDSAKKKSTEAPPVAPEVPKLPSNIPDPKVQDICSICSCNNGTNVLDCSFQSLENHFLDSDWTKLNETGFRFEEVRFESNSLIHLLPFPEIDMKKLNLSNNQIMKIEPRTFRYLQNMVELDLSHNRLVSEFLQPDVFEGNYAPESYEPLRSLRILRLSNNELHTLHPDIFEHMAALETLTLNSNPLKVINRVTEIALSSLPYLQYLDLSYTDIEKLPEHLLHAPRYLKQLHLTGNKFKELPEGLSSALSLEVLNLDENPISNVRGENIFPVMPSLLTLHMCYMGALTTIGEGGLSGLTALKELYLSNNPHLSYIHPSAMSIPEKIIDSKAEGEDWPPLEQLYMHSCNISELDSHLVGRWDVMKVVDLRFNPWSCDCENQWLVSTLLPQILKLTPALAHGLNCNAPIEMKGKNMFDMEEEHKQMRCLDTYGNRPEKDGAMLIGILVGVLLAVPLTTGLFLLYRRGCFGLINKTQGPADFSRAFYKRAGINEDINI